MGPLEAVQELREQIWPPSGTLPSVPVNKLNFEGAQLSLIYDILKTPLKLLQDYSN